uniref:26S proteasome complex subunit SEM1 n=1 Tax=Oryza nivara TaxID=4536 RepID=A0A0E0FKZ6_ORYNI
MPYRPIMPRWCYNGPFAIVLVPWLASPVYYRISPFPDPKQSTSTPIGGRATSSAKPRVLDIQVTLFGPSDYASFSSDEWDDKEEGNEAVQQWEDDWDDDDVNDDFSLQLRKELESIPSKN